MINERFGFFIPFHIWNAIYERGGVKSHHVLDSQIVQTNCTIAFKNIYVVAVDPLYYMWL